MTIKTYEEFEDLMSKSKLSKTIIDTYASSFKLLREIIRMLFDMQYHRHLSKTAQDVEEPFCYRTTNHYPKVFFGVLVMIIGNLMIVIAFLRMLTIRNKMESKIKHND